MRRFMAIIAGSVLLAHSMADASEEPSSLHPPIPLLDAGGQSVLETGEPISTMRSCGSCHDTGYIAAHSYHASAGRNERFAMGTLPGRRAWDYSPGSFGRWNPLIYRYLSPPGDTTLDLGTAEWIQTQGWRHVGGGPAVTGHGDVPLDRQNTVSDASSSVEPDAEVLDPTTRTPHGWDWQASGTVEMNCFVCHVASPDNRARKAELAAGRFQWANTATLATTSVVADKNGGWQYQSNAFSADGTVAADALRLQEPTSQNCGLCHGQTHHGSEPLKLELSLDSWSMATKGQVFSPQRMFESAANLKDKQELSRPWDVHAEALLECSSCHFALNDPASYEPPRRDRPKHLRFEPRRLSTKEYLIRPSHQFAKGQTAQGTIARHLDGTMRRCDDCHDAGAGHDWLPYREAHFARLSCEACHIPETKAPAVRDVDWTLLSPDGEPSIRWRGIEGDVQDPTSLVTGFRPVLMPREDLDGKRRLTPHNLISAWYWVDQGPVPRPVRLADLKAALLVDGEYHPDIAAALDANRDGRIEPDEHVLDNDEKVRAVEQRLVSVGVQNPQIQAEVQPYELHHGVGPAKWATRECNECHSRDSRQGEAFVLASYAPGNVIPKPTGDAVSGFTSAPKIAGDGQVVLQPSTRDADLYVLGHDHWPWVNAFGILSVIGVVFGVVVHTTLRVRAGIRPSARQ